MEREVDVLGEGPLDVQARAPHEEAVVDGKAAVGRVSRLSLHLDVAADGEFFHFAGRGDQRIRLLFRDGVELLLERGVFRGESAEASLHFSEAFLDGGGGGEAREQEEAETSDGRVLHGLGKRSDTS